MWRSPKNKDSNNFVSGNAATDDHHDGDEYGLVPAKSLKRRDMMISNMSPSADSSCNSSSTGTVPTIISDEYNQSADYISVQQELQQHKLQHHQNQKHQTPILKKTPDEVAQLLQLVDTLLERRYRSIKLNDSPYIQDFKETTLRVEGYAPQQTVGRIESHWKLKVELFGPTLSEKKICLHDMILPSPYINSSTTTSSRSSSSPIMSLSSPNDNDNNEESSCGHMQAVIESGVIQLLPTRDLAGRAVLCFKYDPTLLRQDHQNKDILKYMYYMLSTAMEDEETQIKGISLVVFNMTSLSAQNDNNPWGTLLHGAVGAAGGMFMDPFWKLWREIRKLYPIPRFHYCVISSDCCNKPYSSRLSEEGTSTHVRIHQGSLQECFHGLMTLGIPSHVLPIEHDGQLIRQRHLEWIDFRKRTDSMLQQRTRRIVLIPGRNDVLFGRRKYSSQANILFHGLISTNLLEYVQASDKDKKHLRKEIWNCIVRSPRDGRFLQQLDEQSFLWEEMEETVALYKIGQAFEFLGKKLKLKKNSSASRSPGGSNDVNGLVEFGNFMIPPKCWNILRCEGQDECVPVGWALSNR